MRALFRRSVYIAFCCLAVAQANAQSEISLVKGLPVQAIKTRTLTVEGNTSVVTSRLARNSAGSVYVENPNPKTGEIDYIHIDDAPGKRWILLDVKHRLYGIQPFQPHLKIGDSPTPQQKQNTLEMLKTLKSKHVSQDGYEYDETPLGFRTEDSYQEFGRQIVYEQLPQSNHMKEKTWEDWTIPALDITVEKIGFDADGKPENSWKLSEITTNEPDPHLFEIPPNYTPGPNPASQ